MRHDQAVRLAHERSPTDADSRWLRQLYGLERDEISSGGPALRAAASGHVYLAVPAFLRDHGAMILVCESMS